MEKKFEVKRTGHKLILDALVDWKLVGGKGGDTARDKKSEQQTMQIGIVERSAPPKATLYHNMVMKWRKLKAGASELRLGPLCG